jgi:hypothetical protein
MWSECESQRIWPYEAITRHDQHNRPDDCENAWNAEKDAEQHRNPPAGQADETTLEQGLGPETDKEPTIHLR